MVIRDAFMRQEARELDILLGAHLRVKHRPLPLPQKEKDGMFEKPMMNGRTCPFLNQ